MRRLIALALLALATMTAFQVLAQQETERTRNRRALVEMEGAFAKTAATKGTRAAFIEFLADDGIIFQPGPVNGKKYWTEREPRKNLLSWEPIFADVSMAGDLGYTTGPWEFRPNGPDDKPVAFGQYFTIWKRQSDGSWKAVLDRGVGLDRPAAKMQLVTPHDDAKSKEIPDVNVPATRANLMKLEAKFSQASAKNGAVKAFEAYLADDTRLLRQSSEPAIGKTAALGLVSAQMGTLTWQAAMADASRSGDLGYTYGQFDLSNRNQKLEHGSYVRVWKKQGGKWRVVMDVMSPDPTQ